MRRTALSLLTLIVGLSGCVPVVTTTASTPSGQAAIERAVQRGLQRAGLAEPAAVPGTDVAQRVAGPMLADVTQRGVVVWIQTDRPADIELTYIPVATDVPGDPVAVEAVTLPAVRTSGVAHTAAVRVFGLEPGWTYSYGLTVDGQPLNLDYPTQFRTQPLWQYRTDPPTVTLAFGSCYFDNDGPYDRPGNAYGGSTAIFEQIRAKRPDAMLWLGDNVYLREVDWWSREGIAYRYTNSRREPALQRLLASTAHYATWDDHDYGPNNSDRSYVHKDAALETFQAFWPNPTYGVGGVPGTFTHFEMGDVEVFLLDNRYHRAPNFAPPAERTILGDEQMQWLLDALTFSRAPFKLLVFGNQVLNPVEVFENYSNVAPDERQRLLDEIAARGVEGVIFLSGDRHHGELNRLEREGAYPLYDFTSSPLTAGAVETPRDAENPIRVEGTLITGQRNFGTVTVSGARRDRTLTMRAFSAEGALLWEQAVHESELRMPRDE